MFFAVNVWLLEGTARWDYLKVLPLIRLLLFSYVLRRFLSAEGYWNDYDYYSAESTEYLGTKLPLVFISFAIAFVGAAAVLAATVVDSMNDDLPGC